MIELDDPCNLDIPHSASSGKFRKLREHSFLIQVKSPIGWINKYF